MSSPIRWIGSGGGPLLLLPASLLPEWGGSNPSPHGRDVQTTDYDRSCGTRDYLGLITVGQGMGLVLGGEPFATTWWLVRGDKGGLIVRREYGEDDLEERIDEVLMAVPDDFGEKLWLRLSIPSSPLFLFDSAYPGGDVGTRTTYREVQLAPGLYTLTSGFYRPDDSTSLLLHRCSLTDPLL